MDGISYKTLLLSVATSTAIYMLKDYVASQVDIPKMVTTRYKNWRLSRKYPRYFASRAEKDKITDARKILILYHGTKHDLINHRLIDYAKDNVYTVDLDANTNPTIVGDAVSLDTGSVLMSFAPETFDLILVPMCECHLLEQIELVGSDKYLTQLVKLLKTDGLLCITCFYLFHQNTDNHFNLQFLNDLGLRGYNGRTDLSTTVFKFYYGDSIYRWTTFVKRPDNPNLLQDRSGILHQ